MVDEQSLPYLQLEVNPEDRPALTLNTPKELYRPTRLMYGIASAPAIWQREIENILQNIPGVSLFLDDIKVSGPIDAIHLEHLEKVFERLQNYNLWINTEKSEFFNESIDFCGYKIDRTEIHKEHKKMEAINNMPKPKNVTEVRAFIGLINYYGRFIKKI